VLELNNIWIGLGLTGLVCALAWRTSWTRFRDPFHPAFILGAPCFAAYFIQPAMLMWSETRQTLQFLSGPNLQFVVLVNGLGVLALLGATLFRSKLTTEERRRRWRGRTTVNPRRVNLAALGLGTLGFAVFAWGIWNVGGFDEAYGRGYGGGYSSVGYIRDGYWLCLPAIALLFLVPTRGPAKFVPMAIFSSPFFIHGLLGARRGPTGAVLICLILAYGLAHGWRPRLWQFVAGFGALGVLLLVLVANRSELHLHSEEIHLDRGIESYATKAGSSNEFIYGGGAIIGSQKANSFYWGGRYATILFVRPVPRFLWPTKYMFAEKAFGIPNLERAGVNMGTGADTFFKYLGWEVPQGAAPGLIADLWIEFWWGAIAVLFGIGWLYNVAWRNAAAGDPFWTVAYTLMCSFALYLIAQTFEAMLFRFLLTAGGTAMAWVYATGQLPRLRLGAPPIARRAGSRG
jgi:hypothetical protein